MTHEDEDEDDDEVEEGSYHEDRFDDVLRFGFSFGPNGMHIQEPPLFGQIFQEMEEIFSGLGHFGRGTLHRFHSVVVVILEVKLTV